MPSNTGTTTAGLQTLVNFQALTFNQFEVAITSNPNLPFARIGYLYAWAIDITTPFQTRLLHSEPAYRPGNYFLFPNNYGFTNVKYLLLAKWDVPGLAWKATYI